MNCTRTQYSLLNQTALCARLYHKTITFLRSNLRITVMIKYLCNFSTFTLRTHQCCRKNMVTDGLRKFLHKVSIEADYP